MFTQSNDETTTLCGCKNVKSLNATELATVTTEKPVLASRVLSMTINLRRLTMGAINSHAGHEKNQKKGTIN